MGTYITPGNPPGEYNTSNYGYGGGLGTTPGEAANQGKVGLVVIRYPIS